MLGFRFGASQRSHLFTLLPNAYRLIVLAGRRCECYCCLAARHRLLHHLSPLLAGLSHEDLPQGLAFRDNSRVMVAHRAGQERFEASKVCRLRGEQFESLSTIIWIHNQCIDAGVFASSQYKLVHRSTTDHEPQQLAPFGSSCPT